MFTSDLKQETLKKLSRFAILLTGDPGRAEEVMRTAFSSCAARLSELRNEKAVLRCVGKRLRETAMSVGEAPNSTSPVSKLKEPLRSGVALATTELFSPREIVDLVDSRDARPESDTLVNDARAWADQHPIPMNWVEQVDEVTAKAAEGPSFLKNPVVLAGACGVLLLLGVGIWLWMQRLEDFPGRDQVEEMVAENESMTGDEFQPVNKNVGEMGDWFYMSSFAPYQVPQRFASLKVIGARVFKQKDQPVAEMLLDLGDDAKALLYVFRGEALGIKPPPDGKWLRIRTGEWSGAIRTEGVNCYMLALQGGTDELDRLINRIGD